MKSKLLLPLILLAGLIMVNLTVNRAYGQTPQNKLVTQQTMKYTCPMHPEIVQDHPGNCPICGMKLVEKKDKPMGDKPTAPDSAMVMPPPPPQKVKEDTTSMKKGKMKSDSTYRKNDNLKR